MAKTHTIPDYLNAVPEMLLLRVLADGTLNTYEMSQSTTKQTAEKFAFGEATIYLVQHKFE